MTCWMTFWNFLLTFERTDWASEIQLHFNRYLRHSIMTNHFSKFQFFWIWRSALDLIALYLKFWLMLCRWYILLYRKSAVQISCNLNIAYAWLVVETWTMSRWCVLTFYRFWDLQTDHSHKAISVYFWSEDHQ